MFALCPKGELADYNLLLDRTRVHREVDDVAAEAQALRNTNAADRQRVDEVFNHRNTLESQVCPVRTISNNREDVVGVMEWCYCCTQARDVEHQLARHHQALAQRLDEVDPAMKDHFVKLQGRHQMLSSHELPKLQAELNFYEEKAREIEGSTRDPVRNKANW